MENFNPFDVPLNGEYVKGEKHKKSPIRENKEKKIYSKPVMPGQKVVNEKVYSFLRLSFIALVVCVLIGGFMFLNLVKDGYFQSNINQEVHVDPNVTSSTYNNYSFEPTTENDYNYTIVNEINCPEVVCNCGNSS